MMGKGSVLPRGPHALPQDVVIAHQRERLLGATPEAIAELGYADLTVQELIGRAGVSRRTFYQLFDGKLECVLAAHGLVLDRLSEAIGGACSAQAPWPENVATAVDRMLGFAARSPAEVRLAMLSGNAVLEPKLQDAALTAHERFAGFLFAGRKQCREARVPGDLTEPALVGAVTAIVGARLCAGEVAGLEKLTPPLVQMILAPYLGYEQARRVAYATAA